MRLDHLEATQTGAANQKPGEEQETIQQGLLLLTSFLESDLQIGRQFFGDFTIRNDCVVARELTIPDWLKNHTSHIYIMIWYLAQSAKQGCLKSLNIKKLVIQGSLLHALPANIGELSNLQKLILDGNFLSSLPMSIRRMKKLRCLSLYNNDFTHCPLVIGELENLSTLNLGNISLRREAGNHIQYWPEVISKLSRLQSLNLAESGLKTISSSIGQLTHLQSLHLSQNQIQNIPEEIGHCRYLEHVYIDGNALQSLPTSISLLTRLKTLSAKNNSLETLPTELVEILEANIEINNGLEWSCRLSFDTCLGTQLHYLQLQSLCNVIKKSPHLSPKIQTLDLQDWKLESLPKDVSTLVDLQELNLNNNLFGSFPEILFSLENLRTINIQKNNMLKSLQMDFRGNFINRQPVENLFLM